MLADGEARPARTIANPGSSGAEAETLRERCRSLGERAEAFAQAMDFTILYNRRRELFSVGYNLAQGKLDGAHYDLLASEACLTSYLAVGKGDAPPKHWFQLGPGVPTQ